MERSEFKNLDNFIIAKELEEIKEYLKCVLHQLKRLNMSMENGSNKEEK